MANEGNDNGDGAKAKDGIKSRIEKKVDENEQVHMFHVHSRNLRGGVGKKISNDDNYVPYELDDSDSDDIHIDRNEGENNIESVKDNVNLESDNINIGVIF